MFSTSIRKSKTWADAVPTLLKGPPFEWKEQQLEAYDIAFAVKTTSETESMFALVLLISSDVGSSSTTERVERLSLLNGGRDAAIVLLLTGDDSIVKLAQLQAETMNQNVVIPIIPITSVDDLRHRLDSLRRQRHQYLGKQAPPVLSNSDIVSHCVRGPPLSSMQTAYLIDLCTGFKDLTTNVFAPESQRVVRDFLGEVDGQRLIQFFTNGPMLAD
ncbi:hypothetical protein S40285_00792 [Stachybotrys chlorohalonatus IBT 40285]|uniref:Uncharacterized protein n=1 Tax=Stachybotrys chlorohalonatus (strain IBT 40285) TaxID=1283841 RepID=A0A084QJL2_STAC4|nr:hypothetical protein S40285_00792 [Stachybotrys chlorohalonata IBT 40285]